MTSTGKPLPSYFPAWLDRWGARLLNPGMRRVAPWLPGYAVVEHTGRRTGRPYLTPVTVFRKGRVMAVVLFHGETDWARNVLAAGGASLRYHRTTIAVGDPRIMRPHQTCADVPRIARLGNRLAGVLVVDIERPTVPA
ncbi:nitroreductase family deazaflavin-dependent oxidoreductase [Nocardia carnea]|uniref:nitroreductase family deazaflavin-dependent oxidoreductase n=1 Tax=Nocardia carnea TaxID=37328 RepID=UPI002458933B|nr:nitroreductase family deazaflavin-dependent oxidoreductase [Nocardia carnea]